MAAKLLALCLLAVFCLGVCAQQASYCSLPPESGMCLAYFQHYYFNPTSGACEMFVYGGCGGNQNNFNTVADCEAACLA